MLDSKHKDAYNSVCAPKDMLDKILRADKPAKRSYSFTRLASIAACVLLIAMILPLYAGFTQPSVTLSEVPVLAASRSTDIQVPLTLDLDRKTTVTVSYGTLIGHETERTQGRIELIWSFSASDTDDLTLYLKDIFGTRTYKLFYNVNNGSWSIVKK